MSVIKDLCQSLEIIGEISETIFRDLKANGSHKGRALSASLLHEYLSAVDEYKKEVAKPRKKRRPRRIKRLISSCLPLAAETCEAIKLDHPKAKEAVFAHPWRKKTPKRADVLLAVISQGVSNETTIRKQVEREQSESSTSTKKRLGISQSSVNRALSDLEKSGFITRIELPHCCREGASEKVIQVDGDGIIWCQRIARRSLKTYRYDLETGGHHHHLIVYYAAYTLEEFRVECTCYGFRKENFSISSWYEGKSKIEPDLWGYWSGTYSQDVFLPVEVENSDKLDDFETKIKKYMESDIEKDVTITCSEDLTEKCRKILEKLTKEYRSSTATRTAFDLFTLIPLDTKEGWKWSKLRWAGEFILGVWDDLYQPEEDSDNNDDGVEAGDED